MSTGEREEPSASSLRNNDVNEQIRDKFHLLEFMHLRLPLRIRKISKTNMFVMIETSKAILAAAMETDHGLLRDLALEHLQVLEYVNRCMPEDNRIHPPLNREAGADIADSINTLVNEHKRFAEILKQKELFPKQTDEPANSQNVDEVTVTEEDEKELTPATKAATLEVGEAEKAAPRVPAQPLPEGEVGDFANVQASPLAVPAPLLSVDQEEAEDVATPAAVTAPKAVARAEEVQEEAAAQQPSKQENYTDKNKNKRRQCPMCDFFGKHLDRHFKARHEDTSKANAQRLIAESDKGQKISPKTSRSVGVVTWAARK